tara:strand:- start:3648 stop:5633 length:1986 start_codon:yes stop_codon:yes gene_type:complete
MADDSERLVVLLEARIRDFEKNMQKASGTADRTYGRMRRESRTATNAMERDMVQTTSRINQALAASSMRVGAFGRATVAGMAASVAATVSFGAAINGAKSALIEFDRIGKASKSAGLDSEFFQGLSHSAMLAGVGVDQLGQALNTFNKNAGMAAIGKGELVEKLKLLNPELLKNIKASTDQEAKLRLVADAIENETDASLKAAIASAAFGDAGVKMVEMLKGGSAALDDTAQKARDLGIIVDRELIARSEELNDQFSIATKVMDLQFKQAMIDLAPVLISTAELAASLAAGIRDIIDAFREVENKSSQALDTQMATLGMERVRVESEILQIQDEQRNLSGITAILERRTLDGTIKAKREELEKITEQEERILGVIKARSATEEQAAQDRSGDAAQIAALSERAERSTSSRTSSVQKLTDAEKQLLKVKELELDLLFEREQLLRSPVEQRVYAELRSVGVDINSAMGQQLASQIRINEQIADMRDQYEDVGLTIRDTIGGALSDVFTGGIKDFDAFMDRITSGFAQIGQANLQMAFDGLIANDNFKTNTTFGEFIGASVEKGAKSGTAQGGFQAFASGIQMLFGGGQQGAPGGQGGFGGGALSAGLGGFGMGYQSQSPAMGALGGAISGFMAMPGPLAPIGAIVGGPGGRIGSLPFSERTAA